MQLTGKVIQKLPLQTGVSKSGSNWQVQTYIVETLEQYPRKVAVELFNRAADQYKCEIDDVVDISFDLESREFNGRWYTSVRAWRIDNHVQQPSQNDGMMPSAGTPVQAPAQQQAATQQPMQQMQAQTATQPFTAAPDESSDMPF